MLVLKAEGCMPISLFIQALGELQGMGEMQKGERRGKIPHARPSHFFVTYLPPLAAATPPVISMGLQRCAQTLPQTGRILTVPELCSCPSLSRWGQTLQNPNGGSRALLPVPALLSQLLARIPG